MTPPPERADPEAGPTSAEPLLRVEHLTFAYAGRGRRAHGARVVDDVSFSVAPGETLGVVGESGCGKTSLARCVVRLTRPQSGSITFAGRDIVHLGPRALRGVRRDLQMVFQNPFGSLNPRRTVRSILRSAVAAGSRRDGRSSTTIEEMLEQVGMQPEHAARFPGEFSGGQCQRIAIARALAVRPRLLVLDEPVSALDVSIQAQIVNLLARLRAELAVAYVFIAHDLSVVRHISDRVAVMYLGKIVEVAPTEQLFDRPAHWYTRALLEAVPSPDRSELRLEDRTLLQGEPPKVGDSRVGCVFNTRCPAATTLCHSVEPPLITYPHGRSVACHHPAAVDADDLAHLRVSPDSPLSAGSLEQAFPTPVTDRPTVSS